MSDQLKWFKSRHSDDEGGACVEVALSTAVHIRDSKTLAGPELHVTAPAWSAFVSAVQPEA
ncbi:DUF397 domain-containing protein [Streptomyces caelestis]|uniref:DUF397 domain-containing protein n=1 Tax=Streptomyces caelestis TaxID=36816 RepID=A0A7W9LU90_9ACTN|nr:DUF397 domain-containing protein [Streptomyces caelestis]MBB5796450.1 hypothetical protein [Streptomyces caelestis]GGW41147.1 hypothetical protein GCM10010320_21120 [Streptomyces caelestis]